MRLLALGDLDGCGMEGPNREWGVFRGKKAKAGARGGYLL